MSKPSVFSITCHRVKFMPLVENLNISKYVCWVMKVYGTCTACEFEASSDTLEQLDAKFKHHFIIIGHQSYFHKEGTVEKLRKIS